MVSGYSDLGIFNNFGASSIFVLQRTLHPLLAHPGSLDIMSMTFAAGICDADDPCSVNTAYDPESSFTMSPPSTTLPLYFWLQKLYLRILEDKRSINDTKWTFLSSFLASSITSFFVSDFRLLPCRYSLKFYPFFFLWCLCIWNFFEAWSIGINMCSKLSRLSEFIPFAEMWSSWYLCGTPSNRILKDSSASTIQAFLVLSFPKTAAGFAAAIYWCFTRHCCWHRNFQLSTSVVVWHYRALVSQLTTLPSLCFSLHHTYIWPWIVGSWGCLFPRKSPLRPCVPVKVAFRSLKWFLWSLSMHLIILFLHPRSSNHQCVCPTIHPVTYEWFWQRRCVSVE